MKGNNGEETVPAEAPMENPLQQLAPIDQAAMGLYMELVRAAVEKGELDVNLEAADRPRNINVCRVLAILAGDAVDTGLFQLAERRQKVMGQFPRIEVAHTVDLLPESPKE